MGSLISISTSDSDIATVKVGELGLGAVASINNMSVIGDIDVYPGAMLALFGNSNLNNNSLFLCHTPSYVDGNNVTGIANFSTAASDCPGS